MSSFFVISPNVKYNEEFIESSYNYDTTRIEKNNGKLNVYPLNHKMVFRTVKKLPKLGVMLVGWGGNNGTTLTAATLANKEKLSWNTKTGVIQANYFGSITQSATIHLGDNSEDGQIYVPLKNMLPMIDPNDIIFDGWDISSMNLADALIRAKVIDYNLQIQLKPMMKGMKPRPSIYQPDFIAANQAERADNVISGSKKEQMERVQLDIRDFKAKNNLDQVIVLWTANTERYSEVRPGLNTTADELMKSIENNDPEVSPSTLFALASIFENCTYINGSPQNTFVPGVIELAEKKGVFIAGDDFKTGQTKLKSVLVDFLVSAGIKPLAIVSYNHLGNNDGYNLSAPSQFKSKEISKSNVVDDVVNSNRILYPEPGSKPDHCVVIKYVPQVGDSKRAMDEYTSELMLNGHSTIVIHNTCEDSLLAAPVILDLLILAELFERIKFKIVSPENAKEEFQPFHPVMSVLSYLLKAPLVPKGAPVINALFKQKSCIENLIRACVGLPPENHMLLEYKLVGGVEATQAFLGVPEGAKSSSGKATSPASPTQAHTGKIEDHFTANKPKESNEKFPPPAVPTGAPSNTQHASSVPHKSASKQKSPHVIAKKEPSTPTKQAAKN
ncbi:unnamed protein product [Gordionus sp. m RMFG-2023]